MAKVSIDIERFARETRARVEGAMGAVALQGEAALKTKLAQPGSGRIYPRGKTAWHQASAPGEPPAVDTGRLRASTTHEVVREGDAVVAKIAENTQYALALELGTEKIAARPALRPMLAELIPVALRIIRARL